MNLYSISELNKSEHFSIGQVDPQEDILKQTSNVFQSQVVNERDMLSDIDIPCTHQKPPSYLPSQKFYETITDCENDEKNKNLDFINLASLKRQIKLNDEKIAKESIIVRVSIWFLRFFCFSIEGYADCLSDRIYNKLLLDEKNTVDQLVRSYDTLPYSSYLKVDNLNLPEGIYSGHVRNGVPHGEGTLRAQGEKPYKVTFENGKLKGEAKAINLRIKEGKYTGHILDGKPHGIGTLITSEGHKFEGEFEEGKLITGILTYANSTIQEAIHLKVEEGEYTGPFDENGLPHGKGILVTRNNDIIECEYLSGKIILKNSDSEMI